MPKILMLGSLIQEQCELNYYIFSIVLVSDDLSRFFKPKYKLYCHWHSSPRIMQLLCLGSSKLSFEPTCMELNLSRLPSHNNCAAAVILGLLHSTHWRYCLRTGLSNQYHLSGYKRATFAAWCQRWSVRIYAKIVS